ncbi:MAG TPA: tetratricopeptide repeat protein [Alphaproteobacteria bacterium]|nr:tetratricopeptide repeat protein [Micavibrio sp.]MBK9561623.1 tetratricopeptide repeat protein [Micavibrio sp.]HQX26906.1 tetratricopeptide repeat protein [Alphaproteobacteria bacterium]
MFRVVLFSFFLIFASVPGAFAQDTVRLRAGEHDGYARLVFDMGKSPVYSASDNTSGQLVISFSSPATLDDSAYKTDPPKNVSAVKVTSASPLQVTISLAPGSTTRNFSAGNRVVVDIYDPPGAPKPEPEKQAEKKPEAKKAEKKKPEEKKSEPAKVAAAPVAGVAKQTIPEKSPEAPVAIPSIPALPKSQPTAPPNAEDLKKLQQEQVTDAKTGMPAKPNIITLTATKSTGMAVFERDDKIWLISDQEDLMLSPNVVGPDAAAMMPPGTVLITGGKAYTFPRIRAKAIQGQAGGLLWRVIAAPHDIHIEGIRPVREDDNADEPGGGKLIWDLQEPGRILDVPDPVTGRTLKVVTVNSSKFMSGPPLDFVEFETLQTPVGLVILPKVDDLSVEIVRQKIVVTRPGGLQLMANKNIATALSFRQAQQKKTAETGPRKSPEKRIFDFNSWQMGGLQVLEHNRNLLLSTLAGKPKSGQIEGILSLARMHLANGLWAEANGLLNFAIEELPELESNPEFVALDGASNALGRVSDLALDSLNDKGLNSYPEIGYWKAYVLADLQDWQQAGEILPKDIEILAYYPEILIARLGLVLSEVALRSGKLAEGEKILKLVEDHGGKLVFQQEAALTYLKGEAARQNKKPAEAITIWTPLMTGKDAMYRAKSGLAIARLKYENKQITAPQAIDALERLRYAWRGDELEALINYWLGKVYFDTGDYIKGLKIMRDAATFSEGTDLGDRILAEMVETFEKLFTGDALLKISGPDAAALYDEFIALSPGGEKGDVIAEKLADHLVTKELLDRAVTLLQGVMNNKMTNKQGAEAYRIATKLAAIELLDGKSVNALSTLGKAKAILDVLPEDQRLPERYQEISLLRARALSQERRPDQALALLHDLPRSKLVNKLRADIAWRAGYWDDAAEALGDVVNDEEISLTRPLTPEHTGLLMQRAVAMNLASDRIGLANMREKYSDSMAQTDKARVFEVITRARQSGALADRETLMGVVSEVDLFKQFLDNYRASSAPAVPAPAAPAPPADAPPPAAAAPPATN